MAIFGNSNSLPISLVISLSKTLQGLHWDQVPDDNDDDVAARGILYLLIFQQLGQLLRWSWGYHVLLAPEKKYSDGESDMECPRFIEEGLGSDAHTQASDSETDSQCGSDSYQKTLATSENDASAEVLEAENESQNRESSLTSLSFPYVDPSSDMNSLVLRAEPNSTDALIDAATRIHPVYETFGNAISDPNDSNEGSTTATESDIASSNQSMTRKSFYGLKQRLSNSIDQMRNTTCQIMKIATSGLEKLRRVIPKPIRKASRKVCALMRRFFIDLWTFMNPPLWAMLIAVIIASIPELQEFFFKPGTFIQNSITRAIDQSGGVAVPLILVVLGGNLARNTHPQEIDRIKSDEEVKEERNILIASLLSRMVLPTLLMTPLLGVTAWLVPVSILDDPIFIIVCFLLIGSPSALQLAQICQLNNVYVETMSKVLFHSYVLWILPNTLTLVLLGLEILNWAKVI
jgi:auxin efflux carrier family protein